MGYGFVTFKDASIADKAVELLKDKQLDGRLINVQRCVPRAERPPRRERPAGRGLRNERRPRGPPSETMIYIGNLPYTLTSEDLSSMLGDFKTTSCYVVCHKSGKSKGFGFVHAADHNEQLRILAEMKGASVDDRELNVRAATSEGPYGTEDGAQGEH
jgi:RNA recognition motif-containing protein